MESDNNRRDKGLTPIGRVFLKRFGELRYFLSRFLSSESDIEDVLQDTYIRAVEAEKTTAIRAPKAFLYRVSRNLALNHNAQAYTRLTDSLADFDELSVLLEAPLPEERFQDERHFLEFCIAVRRLPAKCRRVFILRKIYGLSNREISVRLGISVSTVETHLARGLLSCRNHLKNRGYLFAGKNDQRKAKREGR